MESTIYHVHTDIYEGPIEVLLRLIEERKLPINEVSLASVTDDYIAYMHASHLPYGQSTQFLIIASTLVLVKSRSLLPTLTLNEEEEGDIAELERRLRVYRVFQKLSSHIEDALHGDRLYMQPSPKRDYVFAPDETLSPQALFESTHDIFAGLPEHEKLEKAQMTAVVRIEDMMDRLQNTIMRDGQLNFNEFVRRGRKPKNKAEAREIKVEVVVGFLALLEMVRNGILSVMQSHNFDDMSIEKRT